MNISRLFQYTGGYKNLDIAPTLCFMLLDRAAIFRETSIFVFIFIYCLSSAEDTAAAWGIIYTYR